MHGTQLAIARNCNPKRLQLGTHEDIAFVVVSPNASLTPFPIVGV